MTTTSTTKATTPLMMMTTTTTIRPMENDEHETTTRRDSSNNDNNNDDTKDDDDDEPSFLQQQQLIMTATTAAAADGKDKDDDDVVVVAVGEEEATTQHFHKKKKKEHQHIQQDDDNDERIRQFRQGLLGGTLLHDRTAQQALLQQTCCLSGGTTTKNHHHHHHHAPSPPPKLVLITGASGTGKTYLAKHALQRLVEQQHVGSSSSSGYFCAGKFEGPCRPEPYQAFVGALTEWTQAVLEHGEQEVNKMRAVLQEAVGEEAAVLTSVIPALERILRSNDDDDNDNNNNNNKATTTTTTAADDTNHDNSNNKEAMIQRFVFVFRSFLRAISSPEKPLVLLLDDLQLADPCSLDLLKHIMVPTMTMTAAATSDTGMYEYNINMNGSIHGLSVNSSHHSRNGSNSRSRSSNIDNIPNDNINYNGGLVVIGTCDDSAVSVDSYLSKTLREMEADTTITHIAIHNFTPPAVAKLLARIMNTDPSSCEALAKVVHRHTQQGNPFYVSQLVQELQETGLLYLDPDLGHWTWDLDDIEEELQLQQGMKNSTSLQPRTVQDFLADKIDRQLDQETKEVLKVAACLGSTVEATPIEYVLGYSAGQSLKLACKKGFLVVDKATGGFAFTHDGIRESIYHLIPEDDRELFHLEVGRRLWRKLDREELDHRLFSVLSQFKLGKRLISRENERVALASLCLHAGRKAARSSTFRMATVYLNFGIELIGELGWINEYELTLALYNAGAEMCMCCADFKRMEELVEAVLEHSRSPLDRVQARAATIYVLGSTDRQQEAIDLGIQVLKDFDEYFPNRLCRAHLLSEWNSVRKLLKGKSDEQLMRRPTLHDPKKLACLQILQLMFLNCLFSRPKMTPYVTLKTMKITMQHGLSPISSVAFSTYAMVCLGGGDDSGAVRYSQLGMKLLDQFGTMAYMPRVYAAYYGVIFSWRHPIQGALEPLMRAYRVGLHTGDSEFAYLCYSCFCFLTVSAGRPLDTAIRYWSAVKESMVDSRQDTMVKMVLPFVQTILFFMDESEDALSFKGRIMDLEKQEQQDFESGRINNAIAIRWNRMMIAYTFDDYVTAYSLTDIFREIRQAVPTIELVSCYFYRAMVCLEMARQGKDFRKQVRSAKKTIKMLKRWATKSPHNVLDKTFTLEAEFASFCGQPDKAYEKFTCAIALAKDASNLQIQALATERLGYHLLRLGQKESAEAFLRRAVQIYDEWKGKAKARFLENKVNSIFAPS